MRLLTGSHSGLLAASGSPPGPPPAEPKPLKPQLPDQLPKGGPTSRHENQAPCYCRGWPCTDELQAAAVQSWGVRPGVRPGLSWMFCVAEGISRGSALPFSGLLSVRPETGAAKGYLDSAKEGTATPGGQ